MVHSQRSKSWTLLAISGCYFGFIAVGERPAALVKIAVEEDAGAERVAVENHNIQMQLCMCFIIFIGCQSNVGSNALFAIWERKKSSKILHSGHTRIETTLPCRPAEKRTPPNVANATD